MKWFQHQSNAHRNLKFQAIINKYGWVGYSRYWILCELVAEQGKNYCISAQKSWKNYLKKSFRISDKKLDEFLKDTADSNLISEKALNKGDLYIPKMKDYSDDYTKRLRTRFGQTTDNVRQEEKRLDKIRLEKKRLDKSRFFSSSFKKNLEKGLKPYYQTMQMRYSQNKWWVIPSEGGKWKEFVGQEKDIKWK